MKQCTVVFLEEIRVKGFNSKVEGEHEKASANCPQNVLLLDVFHNVPPDYNKDFSHRVLYSTVPTQITP